MALGVIRKGRCFGDVILVGPKWFLWLKLKYKKKAFASYLLESTQDETCITY